MNDQMMLPPGFRFHPTDEELITHYLSKKVLDQSFTAIAIAEVDMNKVEPWELQRIHNFGEKEWYFFSVRDKKYPTGMRTNRATTAGYWKATGKDKEIFLGKSLIGMKKTLVFYIGRAPNGEKTNWVSHEYRLEGDSCYTIQKSAKYDWVISRVFHKTCGVNSLPLTEPESDHVHCFSVTTTVADDPSYEIRNSQFSLIPEMWEDLEASFSWKDNIVSVPTLRNTGTEELECKLQY